MNSGLFENQATEAILNSQEAGVVCADRDGLILDLNLPCERIFSLSREALRGSSFWDLNRQFNREKILAALHSENSAHRYFTKHDLGSVIYQAYFMPLRGAAGELTGFAVFILPVMGEMLSMIAETGSEKLEAIGKVTGKLGHDFNNLLGAIRGCVDLLRHKLEKNSIDLALFEKPLSILEASLQKAHMLTNTMRGFVRPGPLSTTRVSLRRCVEGIMELLHESQASPFDIDFEVKTDVLVEVSEMQVVQMIMALCLNALEAMQGAGERHLLIYLEKIRVGAEHTGDLSAGEYAHLAVVDHGVGMTPQIKTRTFEPFFTTKSGGIGKGFGLGLAMAHEIMKKHQGEITIESIPHCGTCVHLYFPEARER